MSAPAVEAHNAFAGQGSVLLDIGDGVGAVVVSMPEEMEGVEIEIRSADGDAHHHVHHHDGHAHHPHVAVVLRPVAGGQVPSLVFPEVAEGSYGLHLKESDQRRLSVEVVSGEVTLAEWPS